MKINQASYVFDILWEKEFSKYYLLNSHWINGSSLNVIFYNTFLRLMNTNHKISITEGLKKLSKWFSFCFNNKILNYLSLKKN